MISKLKIFITLSIFISSYSFAIANMPVFIVVKDEGNLPLPGATIQLAFLNGEVKFSTVTGADGSARLEGIENANYIARIRFIGHLPVEQSIVVTADRRNFQFQLEKSTVDVDEVTVIGRRPMVRQEGDKMIIDPAPVADVSTNTLEVLEKTPGLFVDQEGGVFLGGGAPATILINGREQNMSPRDINTILRALPPNSVQQIEVTRNPSASQSAASTGGIINIVLKQGARLGRSGSVTAGMNQGQAGNRFAGINYNASGNRLSSYFNVNYNHNGSLDEINSTRYLASDNMLRQSSSSRGRADNGLLGYGFNFEASPLVDLNYDGRINVGMGESFGRSYNTLASNLGLITSETINLLDNSNEFLNLQQDLGLRVELDTLGSRWETKFGYSFNRSNNIQGHETSILSPLTPLSSGQGEIAHDRHLIQVQSDLVYRFNNEASFEAGVMATLQRFSSDAGYFLNINGSMVPDNSRTNAFTFNERVTSGYLQGTLPLPAQWTLKTGLRLEHTYMNGQQRVPYDTSFVVNRADLFPYLFLSRPLGGVGGFDMSAFLIYRRTIMRPGYQSLSPGIRYIDQFLYETGNPALAPQFTDNIEANISINEMPIFALGRNITRDIFSQVVYQDETSGNVAVRTFDNLGESRETYFRIMGAIPPGRKYFFAIGTQYSFNVFDGIYEGEPLYFENGSWRFFMFQMFNPTPNTRFTMSGFMMTNGLMNFHELDTFGQLNLGFSQSFLDRRLTLTLSARDVLRTMDTGFRLNQGSMRFHGSRYADNQRFGINLRYNFGIPKRPERPDPSQFDFDTGG